MPLPPAFFDLAARQHGLVSRADARILGVSARDLRRGVASGRLAELGVRVFAVVGAPDSPLRRLMAAVLDTDGIVSAASAAALWQLPGFELLPAHVMSGRRARGTVTTLATVHTTCWIRPSHRTRLQGLPVTTPTRTLFDLSGQIPAGRLERALDTAWSRRLTTGPLLRDMLDDLARRGRPRIRTMRALLDARGDHHVPPESGLEARFEMLARKAGHRRLRRQIDIGDERTWLGRMDFADEVEPVVVQVDSDLHHRALVDVEHDRAQTEALEASGRIVVRVREHDVWYDRARVEAQLRQAYREAQAQRTATLSARRAGSGPPR